MDLLFLEGSYELTTRNLWNIFHVLALSEQLLMPFIQYQQFENYISGNVSIDLFQCHYHAKIINIKSEPSCSFPFLYKGEDEIRNGNWGADDKSSQFGLSGFLPRLHTAYSGGMNTYLSN